MQMPKYGQAVSAPLIEHFLERVPKDGSDYCSQQYMVACAAHRYIAVRA
jgi:hypothetical protein